MLTIKVVLQEGEYREPEGKIHKVHQVVINGRQVYATAEKPDIQTVELLMLRYEESTRPPKLKLKV